MVNNGSKEARKETYIVFDSVVVEILDRVVIFARLKERKEGRKKDERGRRGNEGKKEGRKMKERKQGKERRKGRKKDEGMKGRKEGKTENGRQEEILKEDKEDDDLRPT